jgi:hypothetical protein
MMSILAAFFCPELFVTLTILILVSLFITILFNSFQILNDKNWIKLSVIYTCSFICLILYFSFAKKRFVEFFILLMVAILFFAYVVSQVKRLLSEYVKEHGLKVDDFNIPSKVYIFSIMNSNIDLLTCNFK